MQIVFYVSGHGFGHASRDVELIRAMCALRADAGIVVRTAAPDRLAPGVIPAIRHAYASATLALRLPLHGGFEPMAAVTRDIPFIARRSTRDAGDTRRALGLTGDRPAVLPSFGAYGADLPLALLRRSDSFALVEPAPDPPPGWFYQDLVAAADLVVSKPGYRIESECVANDTAPLYTSRGRIIEYLVFFAEMTHLFLCRY